MAELRSGVMLAALLCAAPAMAQPTSSAPPPAPPPPSSPTPAVAPPAPAPSAPQDPYGNDPVLDEQIAEALVNRAQELLDAKLYVDAKQLAVEALVKRSTGNAADRAHYIIKVVNQALGIKDDPPPTPPSEVKPDEQVDLSPITDPTAFDPSKSPPPEPVDRQPGDSSTASMVHGALYGGVLGATIGAYIGGDSPASVAVPLGLAGGVGAGLASPMIVRKLGWDESQVRTAGSLNLWGGVIGGMFADAVTGSGDSSPSAKGVLLGASIGSTLGLVGGGLLAKDHKLTRGDVALVDTLAGIGTVGGLTLGMLMQPAQPEAYAVNSIIGAAGGVVVGMVAAPNTNTTPRRMLRVAGLAAAGGALPVLLYAAISDSSTDSDERVVGLLSTAGLVGGAYLGLRLTRDMDVGLDVHDGTGSDDAPAAAVSRNTDGSWTFGGIGLQPLSTRLSTGARGMGINVLGGRF